MKDAAIEAVLDRLALRMNMKAPFERGNGPVKRGRGIAVGFKASISPTTSIAIVNVAADGSVTLYCSTVDMGQGSDTANAQLVAEVLNIPAERVKVVHPDTDVTPYDMATLGSRSLYHMGNAVRLAAEDAKAKLAALAKEVGVPEGSNVPVAELFQKKYKMQAGNIIGTGSYIPNYVPPDANGLTPEATPFWMVGGTGAEVEVDTETGHVRVLKLINVADVGRPVNPRIVETQLSGAAVMQFGFTMQEKIEFDGGQITNASFADYKIPSIVDIPPSMQNEAVESEQGTGPFGAKGVGESGTFGVSPAIANAIEDACGVRLTELPLTAERVFRALRCDAGQRRWRRVMRTHPISLSTANRCRHAGGARTRPLSRFCATASICSARARAARRDCAVAAPCWSTEPPCLAASISRCLRRKEGHHGRRPRRGRQTHAHPGSVPGNRRDAMRLLHAGLCADGGRNCSTPIPTPTRTRSGIISPAISAAAPPIPRSSPP